MTSKHSPSCLRLTLQQPIEEATQPITLGVPWPKGVLSTPELVTLKNATGRSVPVQTQATDHWHDGTIRWLLLDFIAQPEDKDEFTLTHATGPAAPVQEHPVSIQSSNHSAPSLFSDVLSCHLDNRNLLAGIALNRQSLFESAEVHIETSQGPLSLAIDSWKTLATGPVRAAVLGRGRLLRAGKHLADLDCRVDLFAGLPVLSMELTLRNPRPADHPGGCWDLGQASSLFVRDFSFHLQIPGTSPQMRLQPEARQPAIGPAGRIELYQDSSGGEHWDSPNHLDAHGSIAPAFKGYRLTADDHTQTGLRAQPIITLSTEPAELSATIQDFWQNAPKALSGDLKGLHVGFLPHQAGRNHELQGGEQTTQRLVLALAEPGQSARLLAAFLHPPCIRPDTQWYCASQTCIHLTSDRTAANKSYEEILRSALDGPNSFAAKAEAIDEFGWRHFGDLYADHEAVFATAPPPITSHYNNQYDPLAGMALQWMRTGEPAWFHAMDRLARHVVDIDIYHTDGDKSAYNHGLFWHTCHYVPADRATHRAYPSTQPVPGGGPSGGHLYATGLLLHYFLTGCERSREAAAGLGQYVIDADDGNKTVFRCLDRGPTGHITDSHNGYHGPGRSSGNALRTCIDAHWITGQQRFLDKAHQILQRCIHPHDNIADRHLENIEQRWFYTMFLKALGRFLDHKAELQQLDEHYAYARAALLHYARWMADHEYPTLDKPDILEYPTETWAAQDLRKSDVFVYAALHADPADRKRFVERAHFFYDKSLATLAEMPTRNLTRPAVLLLTNGLLLPWLRKHPDAAAPPPDVQPDFGHPLRFESQKHRAIRRAKRIAAVCLVLFLFLVGLLVWSLLNA